MIQATDLRIGNYYDHNGAFRKATPETILEVWEAERTWCKPIPITEEILLKCGFEKKDIVKWHGNGYDYQPEGVFTEQQDYVLNVGEDNDIIVRFEKWSLDNDTKMQIHNCNWYVRCYGLINCEIKHLHQLQNLYWCLCGKELEVNL